MPPSPGLPERQETLHTEKIKELPQEKPPDLTLPDPAPAPPAHTARRGSLGPPDPAAPAHTARRGSLAPPDPAAPAHTARRGSLAPPDAEKKQAKPKTRSAYNTALSLAVDPVGDPLRPPRTPAWRGNPKNLVGQPYSTFVQRAKSQPSFFHTDVLPALPRTPSEALRRAHGRSRDSTRQRSRDGLRALRTPSRERARAGPTAALLAALSPGASEGEASGSSITSSDSDGSEGSAAGRALARHAGGIAARLGGRASADPGYGHQGRSLSFARSYEAVRRVVSRDSAAPIPIPIPLAARLVEEAYPSRSPGGTPHSIDGSRSCSSLPPMLHAALGTPEPARGRLGESLGPLRPRPAKARGTWSVGRRVEGAERLELAFYGLGDRRTAALIDPAKGGAGMTSLDARENRLTAAAVPAIVEALRRNPHIQVLDLTSNAIGRDGCLALARALRGPPPLPLTRLSLYNNKIGTYGVCFLVECVKRHATLTALDLSRNDAGEKASLALAETLEQNQTLRVLGMSWNLVRGRAAAALAQALHINVGLTELDLSWNGLGERDGQMLGIALGRNASLRVLDIGHNRLHELACVNIAQGLKQNGALERLVLDANPLGRAGARFMVLAIDNAVIRGIEREVSLVGCDIEAQNSSVFNAQEPSGHYELDLSALYDRVVAEELIKLARELPGENLRNVTHQGRPLGIPDEERGAWQLPTFGTLKFDFVFCRLRPTVPVDDGTVEALMRSVNGEAQVMAKLARVASDALYFSCEQVHRLMDACGAGESMRRVEVVAATFSKILDRENVPGVLERLAPWEREALVRLIGPLYYFVPENPTGHYVLDLKNPHERAVACWLQEIGNLEKQLRAACPDTSQKGNRENWRNESYLRVPFTYEGWWSVPWEGTLEMDFVDTRRPPPDAAPAAPEQLLCLRQQVEAARIEEIDGVYAQRPIVVPGVEQGDGKRPDGGPARRGEWQPMIQALPPKREVVRTALSEAPAALSRGGKKGKKRGAGSPSPSPPGSRRASASAATPATASPGARRPSAFAVPADPPAAPSPSPAPAPAPSPGPDAPGSEASSGEEGAPAPAAVPAAPRRRVSVPSFAGSAASGGSGSEGEQAAPGRPEAAPGTAAAAAAATSRGPLTGRHAGSLTTRRGAGPGTARERGRLGVKERKQLWAQIRVLRSASRDLVFSCEQVREVMEWFGDAYFQVEALVVLFARIADLHALWPSIMLRLDPRYGTLAAHRIGLLNVINPEFMEAKYRLDLSVREEHEVAHWLALLESQEPGDNWFEETYNGMGFECPSFWVREPPHTGIFTVQYTSQSPDMRRRRELREKTLIYRPPAGPAPVNHAV